MTFEGIAALDEQNVDCREGITGLQTFGVIAFTFYLGIIG